MSDAIDRQECIDTMLNACPLLQKAYVLETVNSIPSAERRGKWIIEDNPRNDWYRITCSECGEDVTSKIPCIGFLPNAKPLWDYCPGCGAKMEGAERKNA